MMEQYYPTCPTYQPHPNRSIPDHPNCSPEPRLFLAVLQSFARLVVLVIVAVEVLGAGGMWLLITIEFELLLVEFDLLLVGVVALLMYLGPATYVICL